MRILISFAVVMLWSPLSASATSTVKTKCGVLLALPDWRTLVEPVLPRDGVEILEHVVGTNPSIKKEVTYKSGHVVKVRQFDSESGATQIETTFDLDGKKTSKVYTLPDHSSRTEYEEGREVFDEFIEKGVVMHRIDMRGGKLKDWRVDRVRLWEPETNEMQEYTVNARLKVRGLMRRVAELVTKDGDVLAISEMKKGKPNGMFLMYDPIHLDKPLNVGQFENGARVGIWEDGLSRESLEKSTFEYDSHGNLVYAHRASGMDLTNNYDLNGNKISDIITQPSGKITAGVYEPYSEQLLLSLEFDQSGREISRRRYSRTTGDLIPDSSQR